MTYPEAKQVLTGLLDAFDRDEHGDYFYENGWEVCEAVILAMGAFEDKKVVKTNADHIREITDEELAAWFDHSFCDSRSLDFCKVFDGDCEACVRSWLKQPYKERTHDS